MRSGTRFNTVMPASVRMGALRSPTAALQRKDSNCGCNTPRGMAPKHAPVRASGASDTCAASAPKSAPARKRASKAWVSASNSLQAST